MIYAGENNRINLFGISTIEPSGFYHWYLTSNWSCPWCVTNDKVSTNPGCIQVAENGEVFFIGLDNKLHWYRSNGYSWFHSIMPHPDMGNSRVSGNIVVEPDTNNVFYRGYDGRLQVFYKTEQQHMHNRIDNNLLSFDKLMKNEHLNSHTVSFIERNFI